MSCPITPAQSEFYRRQGFLRYGTLFDESEMDWIRAGVDRLIAARPVDERSERMLNPHHHDEWLMRLATEERVIDLVEGLIGPDIALFNTRLLCKPPFDGYAVPWHQDAGYWPLEPRVAVSFWLAVDDVSEENGALKVMPGMNRRGILEHVKVSADGNVFDEEIRPDLLDERRAVTLNMASGECSFHDIYLPHGSPPNRSSRRRCAFIARYIPTFAKLLRTERPLYGEDYPLYLVRGAPGANRYANR